jgi:RNA polymerase sigma-70 factor, ECF subfamily
MVEDKEKTTNGLRHTPSSANWLAICQCVGTISYSLEPHHQLSLPCLRKECPDCLIGQRIALIRSTRHQTRMGDSLQTEIAREHRLGQSNSPLTATSEALLVISARNGDQLAYAELCRRHREKILRIVLRITRNLDDAEDVLQDSWMRAFTHIGTFDGRAAFSSWVTRIAINAALTTLRKRRGQNELSLDDPGDPDRPRLAQLLEPSRNPEERCLEAERRKLLRQAIRRLPSNLRWAVEIRQSLDVPVSELAILAGVSLPTMKSRLMRARRKLREPLSNVLKGISAFDVLYRTKTTNSVRKPYLLQDRTDNTGVVRDHPSSKTCSVHLNAMNNSERVGPWTIGRGGLCESFSDAGDSDGQSIAN